MHGCLCVVWCWTWSVCCASQAQTRLCRAWPTSRSSCSCSSSNTWPPPISSASPPPANTSTPSPKTINCGGDYIWNALEVRCTCSLIKLLYRIVLSRSSKGIHILLIGQSISEDNSQYSVFYFFGSGRNDSNHDLAQDWYTVSGLSAFTLFQSFDSNILPIFKMHTRYFATANNVCV